MAAERISHTRTWIVIWLIAAVGQVVYAGIRVSIGDSDLVGFHETALHLWRTGELTQQFGWKYYLPGFAVLVVPLLAWPLWLTGPLWGLVNVFVLAWTIRECSRLAGDDTDAAGFHVRWTLPLVAVLVYAADSISLGQFNLFVLSLCVLAYSRFGRRNRDLAAGIATGLAAVIKLFPLFLVGYWLARGRWKIALTTVATFAVVAGGASLAVLGWQDSLAAHRAWLSEVRGERYATTAPAGDSQSDPASVIFRQQPNQWLRHNNQSLAVVVRRLTTDLSSDEYREQPVNLLDLPPATAYRVYLVLAAAVVVLLVASTWHTRQRSDAHGVYAAWLAAVVAMVPVYWTHYFVLGLPAAALLCHRLWDPAQRMRRRRLDRVVFVAWIAGQPLLGIRELRLVGLHCILSLVLAAWAVSSVRRPTA